MKAGRRRRDARSLPTLGGWQDVERSLRSAQDRHLRRASARHLAEANPTTYANLAHMATSKDPAELVVIEHPDVKATAVRTRKQLERLKEKGWREVRGADPATVATTDTKGTG